MNTQVMNETRTTKVVINTLKRVDYRGEKVLTVDGKKCNKHDDAISAMKTKKGYRLAVYTADVPFFVPVNSDYDKNAILKVMNGSDHLVISKKMANNHCSILPGEDKYATAFIFYIGFDGFVHKVEIAKCLIRSKIRGEYSALDSILFGKTHSNKYKSILDELKDMKDLYVLLKSKRLGKNPDAVERKFTSRQMIEEFMILVDEMCTWYLRQEGLPTTFTLTKDGKIDPKFGYEKRTMATSPMRRLSDLKIQQILDMRLNGFSNEEIMNAFDEQIKWIRQMTSKMERNLISVAVKAPLYYICNEDDKADFTELSEHKKQQLCAA